MCRTIFPTYPEGRHSDLGSDICLPKSHAACFHCNITCEHKGSVQTLQREASKRVWVCEECGTDNEIVSQRSRVKGPSILPRDNKGTQVPFKSQKMTQKAKKVKFLPAEEALKLKSGSNTPQKITNVNLGPRTNSSNSLATKSERNRFTPKAATPNYLSLTENGCSSSPVPKHMRCPISSTSETLTDTVVAEDRPGIPICSAVNANTNSESVLPQKQIRSSDCDLSSHLKDKGHTTNDATSKQGVKLRNSETELSRLKLASNLGPLEDPALAKEVRTSSIQEHLTDAAANDPDIQEKKSPITTSNLRKYHPNIPALQVIWKGSFEVLGIAPNAKICEGFLAHPPAKVSRKGYEFSKQIAGVIQFKMHPRGVFWPKIFQIDCPDANDIALYFYPGNFDSSRRKYSTLLKYIEKNDMVLRSQMGFVELLVFASKLLPLDCQKLSGSFFMWGVFCYLKGSAVR